jgi:ATPase subunit of ABC transporter with duplicated ATPase domains
VADVDYQTVTVYTGDYDDFIEQKTTGKRQSDADAAQKRKKIAELKDFVARFGASASRSSQAQSRVKEIEKLQAGITTKRTSVVRPYIKFDVGKPSGRDVLRVEGLSKSFGDVHVLDKLDLALNRGDKLAVIGPSGIGKSTLLKCLVDEYKPDAGKVIWGHDTNVGYFAQDHHEALEPGFSAYEWLYRFDPTAEMEHVRSVLGKLLFSGEAGLKKTEKLSGGEAARLLLAKLILLQNNVVVLDEPTNHLDVESIDALLEALIEFKGTVIVTSHDRHFIGKLGTRVLGLSTTGPRLFNGTYDEYLERFGAEHLER